MSDTIDGNVGVETGTTADTNDYSGIMAELEQEGLLSGGDTEETSDPVAEEPDGTEDEETPEGIPARDTLKVNGKSIEKPYSEIKEMAQKYAATDIKLEKAKKEIEETRTIKNQLTTQQGAVKELLGVLQRGELDKIFDFVSEKLGAGDVYKRSVIQQALKFYEETKMSPEQREAVENRKLIAKYKAEHENRTKQESEQAFKYEVTQWEQHIAVELPKAMTQVGLVDSPYVRQQIITTWKAAIERGQTPTATAVASYIKKQLDEAKINLGAPKVTAPAVRPKATAASVGLKKKGDTTSQYSSWSEWQKNR